MLRLWYGASRCRGALCGERFVLRLLGRYRPMTPEQQAAQAMRRGAKGLCEECAKPVTETFAILAAYDRRPGLCDACSWHQSIEEIRASFEAIAKRMAKAKAEHLHRQVWRHQGASLQPTNQVLESQCPPRRPSRPYQGLR